jgi:hypothetical protein
MQQEGVRAKSRAISILTQVVFVSKHYKSLGLLVAGCGPHKVDTYMHTHAQYIWLENLQKGK